MHCFSCECNNNNNYVWDHDGGEFEGEYRKHLPLVRFEMGDTGSSLEGLKIWAGPIICTHTTVGTLDVSL